MPSYPDAGRPASADTSAGPDPRASATARHLTEPMREIVVAALLAGNAIFLLLGIADLTLVVSGWAGNFEIRSAQTFTTFVGPVAIAAPMAALLLSTHVAPMLAHTRLVVMTVLAQLGASAFFGSIAFLGAFARDLPDARDTLVGVAARSVWLGFLILAAVMAIRIWLGLYPPQRQPAYRMAHRPTYGQPYPGQPMYPQPTYRPGTATPGQPGRPGAAAAMGWPPAEDTGWPAVPPPPMPGPLVVEPEPTQPIPHLREAPDPHLDPTKPMPPSA